MKIAKVTWQERPELCVREKGRKRFRTVGNLLLFGKFEAFFFEHIATLIIFAFPEKKIPFFFSSLLPIQLQLPLFFISDDSFKFRVKNYLKASIPRGRFHVILIPNNL